MASSTRSRTPLPYAPVPDEEDWEAFDRPTVIPSTLPNEDELDSAVLRKGAAAEFDLDDLELPPPRSQAPTITTEDPLAFDLHTAMPPARTESLSLSLDDMPKRPIGGSVPDHLASTLVDAAAPEHEAEPGSEPERTSPQAEMRDRFSLGDFSGALEVAVTLLEQDPMNAEAASYAESCREKLFAMYAAKLGSMQEIPRVIVPPDQVRWLTLDHRAGFVLSCIDGYSTIEEILDVSGMSPLDALRVLHELSQQRIIAVG
ncbi:MAG: hypothetical protein IT374_16730 [Polyangiaceae bacterium]|nr:hypothetical protein [Polyangiaceae bacterium]